MIPAPLQEAVQAALKDAAGRTGSDAASLKVALAEEVTWPNGGMGCPAPGRMYTQALVPGYRIRLLDDHGHEVGPNQLGDLHISGPTSAIQYWNNRERTLATFVGTWTKAGDKYSVDEDGYYTYGGRSDDMLKVSGMYVSPFEVEAALVTHPDVLEAAVIGAHDDQDLSDIVREVVTEQVAALLGVPPHEIDPGIDPDL